MGVFLDHKTLENLLPELNNYIKFLTGEEVLAKAHFFASAGFDDNCIRVLINGRPQGKADTYIGEFWLTEMPGNCGIMVSHGLFIYNDYRKKGIGTFLQYFKRKISEAYGFSQMYCTTLQENEVENRQLEKFGWKKTNTFVNSRSGNTCHEWMLNLKEKLCQ